MWHKRVEHLSYAGIEPATRCAQWVGRVDLKHSAIHSSDDIVWINISSSQANN